MSIQQNVNQLLGQVGMMAGIAKRVYQESPKGIAKAEEARYEAQEKQEQKTIERINTVFSEAQEDAVKNLTQEEADIFTGDKDATEEEQRAVLQKIASTPEGQIALSNIKDTYANEIGLRSKRLATARDPYSEYRALKDVQQRQKTLQKLSNVTWTKQDFKDFYDNLPEGGQE